MRIVCPKCELKGQVDVASASAKTRIACVRCATTFDAVFADGQIQALLPQAAPFETAIELFVASDASPAAPAAAPETVSQVETQEEEEVQLSFASELESAPALRDDFLTSSVEMALEGTIEPPSPVAPQETSPEFAWPSVGTPEALETPAAMQTFSAVEAPLKSVAASKVNQPPDVYGLGVRLMQVSPMWLLLAGLSFISFIVLCNWLIKPEEKTVDAARMIVAADNHATNQSPTRPVASNSTAQSPVNTQRAQSSTQPGVSFIPTDAKEAASHQAATGTETIEKQATEEKPAVQEKAAMPAPSSNQSNEAKAGKVTVQIGSYNEAAQAEERVANLKSAGYEARSVAVEIPKRGTWYRVQSGRFVNRDEAERYGKQLREKGVVANYITTDVQE
jgi:cell division septation protein DedD